MKNWVNFLGSSDSIDFTKFNEAQHQELRKGIDLDLPVRLYANPCLSAQEMANVRNALETAVYALANPDKHVVITDHGPEELYLGFRSDSNFQDHPERICYVPENWDFDDGYGYTGNDFLDLCNGDVQKAKQLFDACEWQHPETVLDEWSREMEEELSLVAESQALPELTVQTKFGELVVSVKSDHDYPGIYIDLKGPNVNAQYQENAVTLAMVEFSPEKDNLQTIVYGDGYAEDFTHLIEYQNILSMEKGKTSLSDQISSASEKAAQQFALGGLRESER